MRNHGLSRRFAARIAARLLAGVAIFLTFSAVSSGAPREMEMCRAFSAYLSAQVQGVLAFVAETGGSEGVARVRRAGTDRFEIRSFTALRCEPIDRMSRRACTFAVDVATVKGAIKQTVSGYFVVGTNDHLAFVPNDRRQMSGG